MARPLEISTRTVFSALGRSTTSSLATCLASAPCNGRPRPGVTGMLFTNTVRSFIGKVSARASTRSRVRLMPSPWSIADRGRSDAPRAG